MYNKFLYIETIDFDFLLYDNLINIFHGRELHVIIFICNREQSFDLIFEYVVKNL